MGVEETPGVVVGETEMASWGRRFLKLAGPSVQWCFPEMGGGRKKGNWVQVTTEQQLGLVWERWGLPVGA